MRILLIFDDGIRLKELNRFIENTKGDKVDLFPLSSNECMITAIEDIFRSKSYNNVVRLDSGRIIHQSLKELRNRLLKWGERLGNFVIEGKTIKEILKTPDQSVSTWWFTLISEKNTLKTDVFFEIAKLEAIYGLIRETQYDICILSINNKILFSTLQGVCLRYIKNVKTIESRSDHRLYSISERFERQLNNIGILGDTIYGLLTLFRCIFRKILSRIFLGTVLRKDVSENPILFISYYPAFEIESAQRGIFKNRYAGNLQEKMKAMNLKINWLMIYVSLENQSYLDAIKWTRKFNQNRENIWLLEEFLNLRAFFNILHTWGLQWYKFIYSSRHAPSDFLSRNLCLKEGEGLLFPIWRQSLIGKIGMQGIIYYELFKLALKNFNTSSHCIYYSEMHAWEKALNSARKRNHETIITIGYQHTAISENYFHYFYHPKEIERTNEELDLPLPDILGCNGNYVYESLSKSKYPILRKLEAVRYLYLNKISEKIYGDKKNRKLLLVAGSVIKNENISLTDIVVNAFPQTVDFDICFKSHPAVPFDNIFRQRGIDIDKTGYVISNSNIAELLEKSDMVLVSTSAVSIEALAFGCEVIVPIFSNCMVMSPIADFIELYHPVSNAEEFKRTIYKIMSGFKLKTIEEYHKFVHNFWILDDELKNWESILKLNRKL